MITMILGTKNAAKVIAIVAASIRPQTQEPDCLSSNPSSASILHLYNKVIKTAPTSHGNCEDSSRQYV